MLQQAKKRIGELTGFIREVANDARIPERDKAIVLAMVALVASPVDIIPDWIPIIGWMDDVVLTAIVLDYFFNVLGDDILLAHWPWGMKSYATARRAARAVAAFAPGWVRKRIWKFQASPYRKR